MSAAVYLCGTPREACTGSHSKDTNANLKISKWHSSPRDAKRCYVRYMKSLGWSLSGGNLLVKEGETSIVLTRESRYGMRLRKGKTILKGKGTSRYMIDRRKGPFI